MSPLIKHINRFLILVCCLGLISCGTVNNLPTPTQPNNKPVTNTAQWDCGPRPQNWPSDEVLKTWTAADIMNLANAYWFWGETCDKLLSYDKLYFNCTDGDLPSCDKIQAMKATLPSTAPITTNPK